MRGEVQTSFSICRFDTTCLSRSILELWSFDINAIRQLETTTQIVAYLASVQISPVYHLDFVAENWLGDLTYNIDDNIINAKSAKMVYAIQATSGDEMNTKIDVSTPR